MQTRLPPLAVACLGGPHHTLDDEGEALVGCKHGHIAHPDAGVLHMSGDDREVLGIHGDEFEHGRVPAARQRFC